jgi:hypothetical protein
MSATEIASPVQGVVHEETRTQGRGFDLTATTIYEVLEPGNVDFGGGELEDADLSPVEASYRNPSDDYQWWNLTEGQYLLQHNESLTGDHTLALQPHSNVVEREARTQ